MMKFVSWHPPRDVDVNASQCARCGSSTMRIECDDCGGDGFRDEYEEDPINNHIDAFAPCDRCDSCGGWQACMSTPEWCEAHPMPGREKNTRGLIEWWWRLGVPA